jgi:hypothetical protein
MNIYIYIYLSIYLSIYLPIYLSARWFQATYSCTLLLIWIIVRSLDEKHDFAP